MKNQKRDLRLVFPFFLVLGILTVVSFLLPLRPTRSNIEKRELAKFPEFSWEALGSGSYFDDITTWFSDTFPGREGWISLSASINELHGHSEITIQGDLPMSETVPQIPDPTEAVPTEVTQATEAEEDPTEPTAWGGVAVTEEHEIELGTVIQIGDTAFNYQGFSQEESDRYAALVSDLALAVKDQGIRVISAPAPTSVGIMVEKEYQEAMRCAPQDEIIGYMHGRMDPQVVTVDTYEALIHHNSEYLYFRTDHHWTALGAYYCYRGICEALGNVPAELDSFEPWDQGPFEGSIAWKAAHHNQIRLDELIAYIPPGDITHMVYNNYGYGHERPLLDDMTDRELNTKYLAFICSDNPLSEITNDSIPDAPNCILLKDSFGNALAPFLTQNYHKVIVVDYRKFFQYKLPELAEKYDVQDIIIAPYLTATQSHQGNDLMMHRCK